MPSRGTCDFTCLAFVNSPKQARTRRCGYIADCHCLKVRSAVVDTPNFDQLERIALQNMVHDVTIVNLLFPWNTRVIESEATVYGLEEPTEDT